MGQSISEFLGTLPEPLTRLGPNRANDAVLGKRVRAELELATERGVFPADTRFSVRFSCHSSMTVEIVAWAGAVFTPEYTLYIIDPAHGTSDNPQMANGHLTPALIKALADATAIADRHNYNRSDSRVDYFDRGYYLDVTAMTVEALSHRGILCDVNPDFAALRDRASEAARALGPKVVRSVCGRVGFEGASEWNLKRLVKIAERANGKPVMYDKRRNGWFPVQEGVAS